MQKRNHSAAANINGEVKGVEERQKGHSMTVSHNGCNEQKRRLLSLVLLLLHCITTATVDVESPRL